MALITSNFAFFHIPRTGGTWIRSALHTMIQFSRGPGNLEIQHREVGGQHATLDMIRDKVPEADDLLKFTIVRDPASWLSSMWTSGLFHHQHENPWDIPDEVFLPGLPRGTWTEFVEAYLNQDQPLVERAFGVYTKDCNMVGSQEDLAGSLLNVFRRYLGQFSTVPINRQPQQIGREDRLSPWRLGQLHRIRELEKSLSHYKSTPGGVQRAVG